MWWKRWLAILPELGGKFSAKQIRVSKNKEWIFTPFYATERY